MNIKVLMLVAYNDWHETEEKDASGKWVEYDYNWMFKPGAMKEIAKYADAIGPAWYMLLDEEKSAPGKLVYTPMAEDIKATKIELIPYTVRRDALPKCCRNIDELFAAMYKDCGAAALFTDFPDLGVRYVEENFK